MYLRQSGFPDKGDDVTLFQFLSADWTNHVTLSDQLSTHSMVTTSPLGEVRGQTCILTLLHLFLRGFEQGAWHRISQYITSHWTHVTCLFDNGGSLVVSVSNRSELDCNQILEGKEGRKIPE